MQHGIASLASGPNKSKKYFFDQSNAVFRRQSSPACKPQAAKVDLQQLFEMIDADGSGAIEAAEFIAPLSRWVRDSKPCACIKIDVSFEGVLC